MQNSITTFNALRAVQTPLNPAENYKNFFPTSIRSFRDFKNFCENEESEENKKNYIEFFLKTTSFENISLDDFGNFLNTHFKNEEQKKLLIDKFISSGKHEKLTPQKIETMLEKTQITDEEYKGKLLILGRIGEIEICNITGGHNAAFSLTTFNHFVANKDQFDDDTKINTLHNLFGKSNQLIDHNIFTTAIKGFDIKDESKRLKLITSFFANKNKFANNINCKDFAEMIKGLGISDEDKKMTFLTQFLNGDKAENNINCKDFAEMIKGLGISDEDKKIKLLNEFLNGDKAENNITCENFSKMVNSLGISDEDKKMKLITEFLGSDKVKISSLRQDDFVESLAIKEDSKKFDLSIIKDALKENDIRAIYQVFDVFKSIFESEGLKANIVENFIINSPQLITQDSVDEYLIQKCSITNQRYIDRINKALTEIYPTQAPTQSIAGSKVEAEEIQQTQEPTQSRSDLEIQNDTESRASSQLSAREANFFKLSRGGDLLREAETKTRIEKWIKESENPNTQLQTITASSIQRQDQRQQNFQPQKDEPLPEYSVTASLVMQRPQPDSQTPTQLSSHTEGRQLTNTKSKECCTIL